MTTTSPSEEQERSFPVPGSRKSCCMMRNSQQYNVKCVAVYYVPLVWVDSVRYLGGVLNCVHSTIM